jgi:hypothetical protein
VLIDAIGDLMPAAVAVALSPFPIVAIVLILSAPLARASGVAFAIGWAAGLAAVAYAVVLLAAAAGGAGLDRPAAAGGLKLVLGTGFILAAVRQWQKRPDPAAEPHTVVGSVLFYLVAPERAARHLRGIRSFMIRNGWIIVMVVLLLLGANLLGDGLARVLG